LDLVMRQNTNTIQAVRERLAGVRDAPAAALTEMAGEGMSNFIVAQRVLLHLAQRENELVMTGVKERAGGLAPVAVMSDLLRRSVDTFIDMQQHFLTIAAKQTDMWIDATKEGTPFEGKGLAELAREGMDNFVRSQKKFLDIVAEETANATNGHAAKGAKKTELTELAREGVEAFIDAQKKLLDVAAQQMSVNVKTVKKAADVVNPFHLPVKSTLADLTRQTVDSFVAAQKALLDVMAKPGHAEAHEAPHHKPPVRKRAAAAKHETVAATA